MSSTYYSRTSQFAVVTQHKLLSVPRFVGFILRLIWRVNSKTRYLVMRSFFFLRITVVSHILQQSFSDETFIVSPFVIFFVIIKGQLTQNFNFKIFSYIFITRAPALELEISLHVIKAQWESWLNWVRFQTMNGNYAIRSIKGSDLLWLQGSDRFLCRPLFNKPTSWRTNMCDNRPISSPDVRSFYCQPSGVASYHGSAMSVVMIRSRKSYYKEQWMDGNRRRGWPRKWWKDNIKEWTDQSMSSLLRVADDKSMGSHHSRGECRRTPTTPGRHRN